MGRAGEKRAGKGRHLAALAALCLLPSLGRPAAAMEINGRYIGSFTRTDFTDPQPLGGAGNDFTTHQLDLWTRGTVPGGMDLRLRAFLRYAAELDDGGDDLFRYRFHADLLSSTWRIESIFVPWQAMNPGSAPAKERLGQVALTVMPPRLPHLLASWQHRETEVANVPAASDDRRVELAYATPIGRTSHAGANAAYRQIDLDQRTTVAGDQETEEFRAGVNAGTSTRNLNIEGGYDFLLSDYGSLERRRDLDIHRLNVSATYSPFRRLSFFGSALERWQTTDDNAFPEPFDSDETYLSGGAVYQPIIPLTFELARDYRQTQDQIGRLVADYLRFETRYADRIWRDVDFLTGFRRTERLNRESPGENRGELPTNTVYGSVDGRIYRGIGGRAELSYQRESGTSDPRSESRQLLQVRTLPRPSTSFDVTWTRTVLPEFAGTRQLNHDWHLLLGYNPTPSLNLTGSYRWTEGLGRIARTDRWLSATASWQASQSLTFGANYERRFGSFRAFETRETVWGLDMNAMLAREFRLMLSMQRFSRELGATNNYYSVSLEKDF